MSHLVLVNDEFDGFDCFVKGLQSPSLFSAWKARAKILVIQSHPPVAVKDQFNKLYQLEKVPSTLVQVSILGLHIYHS